MEISSIQLKNMNQQCKVCGEPAAGFHFGAFTCEGCKSFFGRSYNNLGSITECKNNGECVINKKNRTSCKACRLRKCLLVGMSKSGSRYGRRSNWFKIHCLLQEQKNKSEEGRLVPSLNRNKDEFLLLRLDEYKTASYPSTSSPGSDSSSAHDDVKYLNNNNLPSHPYHARHLLHSHSNPREPTPAFFYPQHHHLVPPSMLLPPLYHPAFAPSLYPTPTPPAWSDLPIDLSVKSSDSLETASVKSEASSSSSIHVDDLQEERIHKDILSRTPLDLTTKVA